MSRLDEATASRGDDIRHLKYVGRNADNHPLYINDPTNGEGIFTTEITWESKNGACRERIYLDGFFCAELSHRESAREDGRIVSSVTKTADGIHNYFFTRKWNMGWCSCGK